MRDVAQLSESYDYIVVGGGSAGCVLAARLSEDSSSSVLLIEAGPAARNPWLHIPSGFFKTINNPRFDWRYETDPEPTLNGRRIAWPRGRVLGGSSAINGLIYIRGQADDFNDWAQRGNPGWSWQDVLPAFKAVESQARGAGEFHGTGGGLSVEDPDAELELVSRFVEAGQQAGLPLNDDFNGAGQEGVGRFQLASAAADGLEVVVPDGVDRGPWPMAWRVSLAVLAGLVVWLVARIGSRIVRRLKDPPPRSA